MQHNLLNKNSLPYLPLLFFFSDIDAKYNKHDRGYRGPLMDFKDKDGYVPDFKLTYIDESGRELNQKEVI